VASLVRFADAVCPLEDTGIGLMGIPDVEPPPTLLSRLRSFDSVFSWYGTNRPEFREAAGQTGPEWEWFAALPPRDFGSHATEFYISQSRAIGGAPVDPIPHVRCHAEVGAYAVIHPFSGSARKNWPLERWRSVAGWLESQMPVFWCVGPEVALEGARRFTDLCALGGWLAGARIFLGNDSGIAHLAAAVGAPVIALFGPSNPVVWAPRGRNVHVVATPHAGEPIEKIGVPEVIAAAEVLLAPGD
jgi:heptosyltransferase III